MFFLQGKMILHYGDLIDGNCLVKIINTTKPTEIYNLGAQSHVKVSFQTSTFRFIKEIKFNWSRFLLISRSTLQKLMELVPWDSLMPFAPADYRILFGFIKLLLLNCMGKFRKFHKRKPLLSTPGVPMVWQSSLLTGKLFTWFLSASFCFASESIY